MKNRRLLRRHDGNLVPTLAFTLAALTTCGALAIDLGRGWVVKKELQNIADATALAGARKLGALYEGLSYEDQQNFMLSGADTQQMEGAMTTLAPRNYAGGTAIALNVADVSISQWDQATRTLTPTTVTPDAVQVVVRRDNTGNNPVTTFFTGLIGMNSLQISAQATAALLPLSTANPGGTGIPVGISKAWFNQGNSCGDEIKFYPTGTLEGCAGWHTFTSSPSNASNLRHILEGLADGTYESPEVIAGHTQFMFTGGTVASAFDEMKDLYDAKKNADGIWETLVVVYDAPDCSNPSGALTIVGFAKAIVTEVVESPDKIIRATLICEVFSQGRGGGPGYGALGTLPALVS